MDPGHKARDDNFVRRRAPSLQAPPQAAVGAALRRRVRLQRVAKTLVGGAVPDLAQGRLRGVAQRVILVALLRKRRDAAGQRAAVGGEVHHAPRPSAQRPRTSLGLARETLTWLGGA